MTMTVPKKMVWLTQAVVAASVFSLAASIAGYTYMRWFDPVAPKMRVSESIVRNYAEPHTNVLRRPGSFESLRTIESSFTATGKASIFFTPAPDEDIVDDPAVTPDQTRFVIANEVLTFHRGRENRRRLFETPRTLTAGDYLFSSEIEFCNLVRCETVTMPGVKVRLIDDGRFGRGNP